MRYIMGASPDEPIEPDDPRIKTFAPVVADIEARLVADEEAFARPGYIGDDQCMRDRRYLLAELRKAWDAGFRN